MDVISGMSSNQSTVLMCVKWKISTFAKKMVVSRKEMTNIKEDTNSLKNLCGQKYGGCMVWDRVLLPEVLGLDLERKLAANENRNQRIGQRSVDETNDRAPVVTLLTDLGYLSQGNVIFCRLDMLQGQPKYTVDGLSVVHDDSESQGHDCVFKNVGEKVCGQGVQSQRRQGVFFLGTNPSTQAIGENPNHVSQGLRTNQKRCGATV